MSVVNTECYVMDVTHWPEYCFLWVRVTIDASKNYESYQYEIEHWPRFKSERCPGKLIGLYHARGKSSEDKWWRNHPRWHEQHRAERLHNFYADRTGGIADVELRAYIPDSIYSTDEQS